MATRLGPWTTCLIGSAQAQTRIQAGTGVAEAKAATPRLLVR